MTDDDEGGRFFAIITCFLFVKQFFTQCDTDLAQTPSLGTAQTLLRMVGKRFLLLLLVLYVPIFANLKCVFAS